MGSIKDIVDLISKLEEGIKDRKFLSDLREIKAEVRTLYSEYATLADQNSALRQEKMSLEAKIAAFEKDVLEAKTSRTQLKSQLDEIIEQILLFVASAPGQITKEMVVQHFNLASVKVDYFFDQLKERKFVRISSAIQGVAVFWTVTSEAREYLHVRGLI